MWKTRWGGEKREGVVRHNNSENKQTWIKYTFKCEIKCDSMQTFFKTIKYNVHLHNNREDKTTVREKKCVCERKLHDLDNEIEKLNGEMGVC
jgi:hypothetical protein